LKQVINLLSLSEYYSKYRTTLTILPKQNIVESDFKRTYEGYPAETGMTLENAEKRALVIFAVGK
jgi:hypothetical protein